MKHSIIQSAAIVMISAVVFVSCVQDMNMENTQSELTTRSVDEKNADVDFHYIRGEKRYFDIRKDRVIVKTASIDDAEKLSKQQDVFFSGEKAITAGRWVVASAEDRKVDMNARLNSKEKDAFDVAYGLEYNGLMQWPTNKIFVKCKGGESPENVLAKTGLSEKVEDMELSNPRAMIYTITIDVKLSEILEISREMYETGLCEFAEPNFIRELEPRPAATSMSAPLSSEPYGWNIGRIRADEVWYHTYLATTGYDVRVAVIDDGVDLEHPALYGRFITDTETGNVMGYDAFFHSGLSNENTYGGIPSGLISGRNAHGTACAGILAAYSDDDPARGVAGGCKIIPVRVTDMVGSMISDQAVANAINWAWESVANGGAGADVISCSWSRHDDYSAIQAELNDALTLGRNPTGNDPKGCVVVFAAGNDNGNYIYGVAASNDSILVVGAMDMNGRRASQSNNQGLDHNHPNYVNWVGSSYGTDLDVMAPGVNIPTTDLRGDDGYTFTDFCKFHATSSATPHVAGVAALILEDNPNLKAKQVHDIITRTARKVGNYAYKSTPGDPNGTRHDEMGYGMVDAYTAVLAANYGAAAVVTGPDSIQMNTAASYSVSSIAGANFGVWTISKSGEPNANSWTRSGGTTIGSPLNITYIAAGTYTLTATFSKSGLPPYSVSKTVTVTALPVPPSLPTITINGPGSVDVGTSVHYSLPMPLPSGVTFTGWSISPNNNYTPNPLPDIPTFDVNFTSSGDYELTANFKMPAPDNRTFSSTKNVNASVPVIYPDWTGPTFVELHTTNQYSLTPWPLPSNITFNSWQMIPLGSTQANYSIYSSATDPTPEISFHAEGSYYMWIHYTVSGSGNSSSSTPRVIRVVPPIEQFYPDVELWHMGGNNPIRVGDRVMVSVTNIPDYLESCPVEWTVNGQTWTDTSYAPIYVFMQSGGLNVSFRLISGSRSSVLGYDSL